MSNEQTDEEKAREIAEGIEGLSFDVTWRLEVGSVQCVTLDPGAYRLLMMHALRSPGIRWDGGELMVGAVVLRCGGFDDEYVPTREHETVEDAIMEARGHVGDTTFLFTWQGVSTPVYAGDSVGTVANLWRAARGTKEPTTDE